MRRYLVAAISSLIMVEPVVALDLGVGVKSGGISVGASVGVGKKGASLGLGAGLGSTGVTAGASVDKDKAGVSAGVTSGGKVGGLSVGATTGKSTQYGWRHKLNVDLNVWNIILRWPRYQRLESFQGFHRGAPNPKTKAQPKLSSEPPWQKAIPGLYRFLDPYFLLATAAAEKPKGLLRSSLAHHSRLSGLAEMRWRKPQRNLA